jgi:hypothetical protein
VVNGPGKLPEPLPLPPVPETRRPVVSPESKRAAKDESAPEPAAKVTLSAQVIELRSLAAKAVSIPESRPDRIEEARRSINSQGDAAAVNARIAEKLLTES